MGRSIQEWTKKALWKTAFKWFEVIWSAEADHITLNFVKAVFHKFYFIPNVSCIEAATRGALFKKVF